METVVRTLAFVVSLTYVLQATALLVQYKVNKTYSGIGWWLSGSAVMALGYILLPLVTVKPLAILARVANPLIILGLIFLYIGIERFLGIKENKRTSALIFIVTTLSYYYYMYLQNNTSARTIVLCAATVLLAFLIAYKLFTKKEKRVASSANFTAIIFFLFGCFNIVRIFLAFSLFPANSYLDQLQVLMISFVVTIITGTLWTFGLVIMVNQRLNAENLIEKEKLQLVFDATPDATLITRLSDGLYIDVNNGFLEMCGYTRDEIIGKSTVDTNLWQRSTDRELLINALTEKGICENMEFVFQRKDRSQFVGITSAKLIPFQGELHIISVTRDITERKMAEEMLIESEETYRSILNASPDAITITDLMGQILIVSPVAKKMFGYEMDYDGFLGRRMIDYIMPEDVERAQANIMLMYERKSTSPNVYRGVRKDKRIIDLEINSDFIRNANGQPTRMVFIIRDITERKHVEHQIQGLVQQLEKERNAAQLNSITDSLTGIANRRYFDEALKAEFFRLKRSGAILSLIMLDVDHFKKFNDRYGHLAGDNCLRQIGTILKKVVGRAPDIVARYGGEEFVLVLPETKEEGAEALAEKIRQEVEALALPHDSSEVSKWVTVSLGVVTVYTTSLESPEEVVEMADQAMYTAKQTGRNRVVVSENSIRE